MNSQHAVLLINLGSPDAPTVPAIARYLGEFLSDRHVVGLPPIIWQPILRGIILRTRPKRLVAQYRMIWDNTVAPENGAPLKAITLAQAGYLTQYFAQHSAAQNPRQNSRVYWAMRYQNPSIARALAQMADDGITDVIVLPLYPQYSRTTTHTAVEAIGNAVYALAKQRKRRNDEPLFRIRTIHDYHRHPLYIDALAQSVRAHWQVHGLPDFVAGDKLLLSFHGLPQKLIDRGDPYQAQCQTTHHLLAAVLGLNTDQVLIAYQSRFGRQQWIQPYAIELLENLGKNGARRVDVLCPGFAADCLETLEEVAHLLKAVFVEHGGQTYHYIPCLNTTPAHIEMMAQLVLTD